MKAYQEDMSTKLDQYSSQNFENVIEDHTLGLAFDTYSHMFTVYYDSQVRRTYVTSSKINSKIAPFCSEGSGKLGTYTDKIHVNFGPDFDKEIPYGYSPWNSNNKPKSCRMIWRFHTIHLFQTIFIFGINK